MSMDDLVWCKIFSPDLSLWDPLNTGLRHAAFPSIYPHERSSGDRP
jgi:hypothetical protein